MVGKALKKAAKATGRPIKKVLEDWGKDRFNIAPTQQAITLQLEDGAWAPRFRSWGLIPSWSKDASIAAKLINARAETVAEKPSF